MASPLQVNLAVGLFFALAIRAELDQDFVAEFQAVFGLRAVCVVGGYADVSFDWSSADGSEGCGSAYVVAFTHF